MDFYRIAERSPKRGVIEIYPDFKIGKSKDFMVRAKTFYAIWDEEKRMWSQDEYDVQRLVDADLIEHQKRLDSFTENKIHPQLLSSFSSRSWKEYRNFLTHSPDSAKPLDSKLTFANTETKKTDYVSKRLPYPLEPGSYAAWDELVGTLYDSEERLKIEWSIGSIAAGDSRSIQKFCVLYGDAGTGKSTMLNIIQKLFEGYYTVFEAKALTSSNNAFAAEVFKANPLVAIQHDGDLSRIEDNTKLNSIISHEEIVINEKHKPLYSTKINCFLFIGTNKPVKITDAKSGIIRRLIDIRPTGKKIPSAHYEALMSQIDFELGAIAHHCLEVYREHGKNYFSSYRPTDMILKTDVFYNFVEEYYDTFLEQNGATLAQAYTMYKEYCNEALVEFKLPLYKFREELKNYFSEFHERCQINGERKRNWYSGFSLQKFYNTGRPQPPDTPSMIVLDQDVSLLDEMLVDCPAQYANDHEVPIRKWEENATVLGDIDTHKLHYVQVPRDHVVIDFDLTDEAGGKSMEKNLEAASKWPATYAEFSKGGGGVHLHYIYEGDASELSRVYDDGIEIKVSTGGASLRRKLTKCNNIPVATINSGLPLKEKKTVIDFEGFRNEKALREMINRNLRKEIHPGTKPSVDFIKKILDEAHASGMSYDVSDLRNKIIVFANGSTHHAAYCLKLVTQMPFASEDVGAPTPFKSSELVFFDTEVFPNLFVISWKTEGSPKCVRMINPTPQDVEKLLDLKLIGFNNRNYDNHILYGRLLGYSNEQLYQLSKKIIGGTSHAAGKFGEAYNLSYADLYDFVSDKKSLKRFQIEMGLNHQELGLDWDKPVPEEMWEKVAEYCDNDVVTLEQVFHARKADFTARQILAELSGLSMNDTTRQHTGRIIFGKEKAPHTSFVYTDLGEQFPGYTYEWGKSSYKGEDPGEGGYVYSEPGMYTDVALLDVASMHPTSAVVLNLFGPYTEKFKEILDARLAIKSENFEAAHGMLGGILDKYLTDPEGASDLAYALKIVINSVYGYTSAKFPNLFRDERNVDNIVAKRGALFMIDLKQAVQERGFTVAHIKTDSIKIPNATPEIIEFVMEFGNNYGYTFEHENTYSKMCLVNDAVYVAMPTKGKHAGEWTAVGAQFQQPYVYKKLFSREPIAFKDMCEIKTVTTALYLDMNERLPEGEHDYHFVGRAGQFTPVVPGAGGGVLVREKNGEYSAATGTKGYRWMESTMVKELGKESEVDRSYYDAMVDSAVAKISEFGDFEWFTADQELLAA